MSQFYGKNSSQKRINRLIKELRVSLSRNISGNRTSIQFDYSKALFELIVFQLESLGKKGVGNVLKILAFYNLSLENFKEHLVDIGFRNQNENRMKNIPVAVKSALSKGYNQKFKDGIKEVKGNKNQNK